MGNQHQGGSYEEHHASLSTDTECTVKKSRSTLDGIQHPFVAALLQQEN